jgi:hypothetical protein
MNLHPNIKMIQRNTGRNHTWSYSFYHQIEIVKEPGTFVDNFRSIKPVIELEQIATIISLKD